MENMRSPYGGFSIVSATIKNGASLSDVTAGQQHLVGIQMPAAWDAAALTFAGSVDGTNFFPVYDQLGNEVMLPNVAASTYVAVPPMLLPRVPYLKVRSGTNANAVNQTADRALLMAFARYQ